MFTLFRAMTDDTVYLDAEETLVVVSHWGPGVPRKTKRAQVRAAADERVWVIERLRIAWPYGRDDNNCSRYRAAIENMVVCGIGVGYLDGQPAHLFKTPGGSILKFKVDNTTEGWLHANTQAVQSGLWKLIPKGFLGVPGEGEEVVHTEIAERIASDLGLAVSLVTNGKGEIVIGGQPLNEYEQWMLTDWIRKNLV